MNFVRNLAKCPLKVQNTVWTSSLQEIRSTSFHIQAACWQTASAETQEITPASTAEQVKNSAIQGEELDKLYRVVEVEVRGHDPAVLKSYSWFATTAANELGITVGNCWVPRKPYHDRMTLLKSVHIFKKHRVQYEMRTYFRFMQFLKLTGSTADTFLEYIQRNLPEGVAMKVTKSEITSIPSHIRAPVGKKPQKLLSKPE